MPVIEKGIPVSHYRTIYPFKNMEVGDSVFYEGETSQGRAAMSAKNAMRNSHMKFTARTVEGGVRIWRTL